LGLEATPISEDEAQSLRELAYNARNAGRAAAQAVKDLEDGIAEERIRK